MAFYSSETSGTSVNLYQITWRLHLKMQQYSKSYVHQQLISNKADIISQTCYCLTAASLQNMSKSETSRSKINNSVGEMYVQPNTEAHQDLCFLDPSQMFVPFGPLCGLTFFYCSQFCACLRMVSHLSGSVILFVCRRHFLNVCFSFDLLIFIKNT